MLYIGFTQVMLYGVVVRRGLHWSCINLTIVNRTWDPHEEPPAPGLAIGHDPGIQLREIGPHANRRSAGRSGSYQSTVLVWL